MKKNKSFQFIFSILVCIFIIFAGFLGVFDKKNGIYKNKIPNYVLASDIEGSNVLEFEVDTSTKEVYYDKEGKQIDAENVTDENKAEYIVKEEFVNPAENLTKENYLAVSKIMEERLKFLKTDQYRIDVDETTGKIVLTYEDEYSQDIESFLPMVGSLEIIDSNTKNVLWNSQDFQNVESSYASVEEGYIAYFNIKLNQSGLAKVKQIEEYKNGTDDETEETVINHCIVQLDGEKIAEVSYDDILVIGKTLRITTHQKLTENKTIQSALNTNAIVAKLASIGKMPLTYQLTAKEYVQSTGTHYLSYIILAFIVTCDIMFIFWMIKYRLDGVLASLGNITMIAAFLIIIRLTAIPISLNGLAGMYALLALNFVVTNHILQNVQVKDKTFSENMKNAYMQSVDVLAVMLFTFIVLAFSKMTNMNSAGLLMFWGWLIITFGNLVTTIPMLATIKRK